MSNDISGHEALKILKADIMALVEGDKRLWEFKAQIERILSHLDSEILTSSSHDKLIQVHDRMLRGTEERQGLDRRVEKVEDFTKQIKKYMNSLLLGVLALVAKAIWELVKTQRIP